MYQTRDRKLLARDRFFSLETVNALCFTFMFCPCSSLSRLQPEQWAARKELESERVSKGWWKHYCISVWDTRRHTVAWTKGSQIRGSLVDPWSLSGTPFLFRAPLSCSLDSLQECLTRLRSAFQEVDEREGSKMVGPAL